MAILCSKRNQSIAGFERVVVKGENDAEVGKVDKDIEAAVAHQG